MKRRQRPPPSSRAFHSLFFPLAKQIASNAGQRFPFSNWGLGEVKRKNCLSFSFSHSALVLKLRSRVRRFSKKKKKTSVCRPRMFQCPNSQYRKSSNKPPPEDSFFSDSFEGRLNREGGLIYLEKTVVSVLTQDTKWRSASTRSWRSWSRGSKTNPPDFLLVNKDNKLSGISPHEGLQL